MKYQYFLSNCPSSIEEYGVQEVIEVVSRMRQNGLRRPLPKVHFRALSTYPAFSLLKKLKGIYEE